MTTQELLTSIQAKFPGLPEIPKVQGQVRGDELYVAVSATHLVELCRYLRYDPPLSFDFLSFVTSTDWKTHFEVVYYLVSTVHKHKLVLKVKLEDRSKPEVPTISTLWPTADWQEREIFDLMGIHFTGHYNMRRILLPENWEGYPLRKDYVAKPDRYD
jgi:NADH:ubiquinone oxidoreductase subunit C